MSSEYLLTKFSKIFLNLWLFSEKQAEGLGIVKLFDGFFPHPQPPEGEPDCLVQNLFPRRFVVDDRLLRQVHSGDHDRQVMGKEQQVPLADRAGRQISGRQGGIDKLDHPGKVFGEVVVEKKPGEGAVSKTTVEDHSVARLHANLPTRATDDVRAHRVIDDVDE